MVSTQSSTCSPAAIMVETILAVKLGEDIGLYAAAHAIGQHDELGAICGVHDFHVIAAERFRHIYCSFASRYPRRDYSLLIDSFSLLTAIFVSAAVSPSRDAISCTMRICFSTTLSVISTVWRLMDSFWAR